MKGRENTSEDKKLKMTVSLSVIEALGERLYSSVPPVLSEIIANAWDADATQVKITHNQEEKEITIEDDGHGMTREDVGEKYLVIGRKRRKADRGRSLAGRSLMGRKGLGKLAAFGVCKIYEIHTKSKHGGGVALSLDREKIKKDANQKYPTASTSYPLEEITSVREKHGTTIILKGLTVDLRDLHKTLPRRIAARFRVINRGFKVEIKEGEQCKTVTPEDNETYGKMQFLWPVGPFEEENISDWKIFNDRSTKGDLEVMEPLKATIEMGERECTIKGWVGTVEKPSNLKIDEESYHSVNVFMHGKMCHENILEVVKGNSSWYNQYITGVIEADFLDDNAEVDHAATTRQKLDEKSDEFKKICELVGEWLKRIEPEWSEKRQKRKEKKGEKEVSEFFNGLQKYPLPGKKLAEEINKAVYAIEKGEKPGAIGTFLTRSLIFPVDEDLLAQCDEDVVKSFQEQNYFEVFLRMYNAFENKVKALTNSNDKVEVVYRRAFLSGKPGAPLLQFPSDQSENEEKRKNRQHAVYHFACALLRMRNMNAHVPNKKCTFADDKDWGRAIAVLSFAYKKVMEAKRANGQPTPSSE